MHLFSTRCSNSCFEFSARPPLSLPLLSPVCLTHSSPPFGLRATSIECLPMLARPVCALTPSVAKWSETLNGMQGSPANWIGSFRAFHQIMCNNFTLKRPHSPSMHPPFSLPRHRRLTVTHHPRNPWTPDSPEAMS